jgi:alpha-ribazole phosphatase
MSSFFLHLLRHGAPEKPGLLLGHADMPSTPEGIAACVAQVADLSFAALLSSDLGRASAAADVIGTGRGLPVRQDARWRELHFGAWDGLAPAQVDTTAMSAFWDNPDANPPPEGERWSALVARVSAALDDVAERDTLVVTHGGAIRAALAALFGFDQRQLWAFDLPYAAAMTLRLWSGPSRSAQIVGLWA